MKKYHRNITRLGYEPTTLAIFNSLFSVGALWCWCFRAYLFETSSLFQSTSWIEDSLIYFNPVQNEIQMVLDLGASPENVIFAHPYKQESHIRFVQEKGVRKMTFDTEEELYKVKRIYPGAE